MGGGRRNPSEESLLLVFSRLKPYCLGLDLVRNLRTCLLPCRMADFILKPRRRLAALSHYTLFPFLLCWMRRCSGRKKRLTRMGFWNTGSPLGGHAISDSVAEGC
ncbi:unnamed protein product [Musa acuminata var. zebrina]